MGVNDISRDEERVEALINVGLDLSRNEEECLKLFGLLFNQLFPLLWGILPSHPLEKNRFEFPVNAIYSSKVSLHNSQKLSQRELRRKLHEQRFRLLFLTLTGDKLADRAIKILLLAQNIVNQRLSHVDKSCQGVIRLRTSLAHSLVKLSHGVHETIVNLLLTLFHGASLRDRGPLRAWLTSYLRRHTLLWSWLSGHRRDSLHRSNQADYRLKLSLVSMSVYSCLTNLILDLKSPVKMSH